MVETRSARKRRLGRSRTSDGSGKGSGGSARSGSNKGAAVSGPITAEGLANIKAHKYVGGKYTLLDELLNPFWFWATGLLPRWVAPNLVTLLGLCFTASAYAAVWLTCESVSAPGPDPRVMAFCAVALWLYQTLDAMDGKQARRTGSATPLGQLFDHGCDALSVGFLHGMVATCCLIGPTQWYMMTLTSAYVTFFAGQWIEHQSGVLPTAIFIAGPVGFGVSEIQYSAMALFAGWAWCGPELLTAPSPVDLSSIPILSSLLPSPQGGATAEGGYTRGHLLCTGLIVLLYGASLGVVLGEVPALVRNGTFFRAISEFAPVGLLGAAAVTWPDWLVAEHCRLLGLATSLLFAHMINQIITASMAKQRFCVEQYEIIPYLALWAWANFVSVDSDPERERKATQAVALLCAVSVYVWVAWVTRAIEQITQKLGIRCFHIIPNPQ